MNLTSLHLLLTYQCTLECDHCFVWGSPSQTGTMTLEEIRLILEQARELGTVSSIYFEGGEPFLYYAVLLQAAREAARLGFEVGVVTNGYWATSADSCLENLRPFAGLVQDLSISSDAYHWGDAYGEQAHFVEQAALELGIPHGVISVAAPCSPAGPDSGQSSVMFRGRAAEKLASCSPGKPWEAFTTCPNEDLREPGRVHIDPFGYVHLCQGIAVGNIHHSRLVDICTGFRPEEHPIVGALVAGGPAELVRRFKVPHAERYADACHLCYSARDSLRTRFPETLAPGQMYGKPFAVTSGS